MNQVKLLKLHDEQRRIAQAFNEHPRVILRCGRRFGKTSLLERTAIKRAVNGALVGWFGPQYRLNTPTYNRISRIAAPQVVRKSKIDQIIEMHSGGAVEFWTLNDEDAGRSRFYDLVIIDEASLVEKGLRDTWEQAIAPTLLDRRGSAIMAGTPKGIDPDNFFYEACTNKELGWVEFHAPTSLNPMLDSKAVERLVHEYPPLVYQQEYLAEFVDWSGSAFFSESSLLVDGNPIEFPGRCDSVFAIIDTAVKDGLDHDGTAVIYCAKDRRSASPLVLLDWDIIQIQGYLLESWLPGVYQRLEELSQVCHARYGSAGAWIEDKVTGTVLLQHAQNKGLQAEAINSELTALGKEARAISASPYVYRGEVKCSQYAYDKTVNFRGQTRNHLLHQVCGFRMGTKTPHGMDLLDCFTYAVMLGLGDSDGY